MSYVNIYLPEVKSPGKERGLSQILGRAGGNWPPGLQRCASKNLDAPGKERFNDVEQGTKRCRVSFRPVAPVNQVGVPPKDQTTIAMTCLSC